MIRMPHLANHPNPTDANMHWNYKDQLLQIDMRGEGTAYYIYDATGKRIRKVLEKSPGLVEERIYLGSFEVFRKRNGFGDITLERETLNVMVDKECIALVDTCTRGQEVDVPMQLVRYQFDNHLGSASIELDDYAKIISYEEYTPYGSTSFQSGRILAEVSSRDIDMQGWKEMRRLVYVIMDLDTTYHGWEDGLAVIHLFLFPLI